ncbi:SH3 domain-containing protein [Streptomyces sp. AM 2-1-1]|uniref:SH3 domain-containing protein n=1 Tax=unclassified Streptomyces TaxID=2593676 RepID=UPI0023B9351E|nr:SH3 domain-containing protein [Streptomyces sp. AM 2-1-1]WEH39689.1 SH3 domain-containing protein [Streptomyces sp. AM 2-1-1]
MSSPSLRRIGIGVATGLLAALTAAAPAFAAGPLPQPVDQHHHVISAATDPAPGHGKPAQQGRPSAEPQVDPAEHREPSAGTEVKPAAPLATYRGRVIARPSLLLRDRPTRSSRVVGEVPYGTVVTIFCKTRGDSVDGNDRWYLLTDGTWAWGSARYIENIGAAPDWC